MSAGVDAELVVTAPKVVAEQEVDGAHLLDLGSIAKYGLTGGTVPNSMAHSSRMTRGRGSSGTQTLTVGSVQASETGGPCNGPDAATLAEKAGKVADGHAVFANEAGAVQFFGETLYSFRSVGAAKHYLQLLRASIKACTTGWSAHLSPDPADPIGQLTIKLLPFTKLADERVASHYVDTTLLDTTDSVVLRVGNHVSAVELTGGSANLGAGSPSELRTYAKRALDHLAAALRQATTK